MGLVFILSFYFLLIFGCYEAVFLLPGVALPFF